MDVRAELKRIAAIICRARCDLSNEKATQADLEKVLIGADRAFIREARLGPGDIPDFLIDDRFVVEVKLRSTGKKNVFRQLSRYAAYPKVEGLLLVSNLSMSLPAEIGSKPAVMVGLGVAWL